MFFYFGESYQFVRGLFIKKIYKKDISCVFYIHPIWFFFLNLQNP